jgi:hypothetical protein
MLRCTHERGGFPTYFKFSISALPNLPDKHRPARSFHLDIVFYASSSSLTLILFIIENCGKLLMPHAKKFRILTAAFPYDRYFFFI